MFTFDFAIIPILIPTLLYANYWWVHFPYIVNIKKAGLKSFCLCVLITLNFGLIKFYKQKGMELDHVLHS